MNIFLFAYHAAERNESGPKSKTCYHLELSLKAVLYDTERHTNSKKLYDTVSHSNNQNLDGEMF